MGFSFFDHLVRFWWQNGTHKQTASPEVVTPLLPIVQSLIEKQGPITLEHYMQIALHDPAHGYYRQGDRLGDGGDFVTCAEISQMFGEMMGVWAYDTWQKMGELEAFVLLELGPGRGTLMKHFLSGTAQIEAFHQAMQLYLMESNVTLRAIQQQEITQSVPTYIEDIDHLPSLPVLAIGNEFFDTFPFRQFVKTKKAWRERLVGLKHGHLVFVEGEEMAHPFDEAAGQGQKAGWFSEVSPLSQKIVGQLAGHIAQHGGACVLIDYGYDVPYGDNTLFAFRKHDAPDILSTPGETDVTAEVDFAALRRAAEGAGGKVWGTLGQGAFLRALGIEWRAELLRRAAPQRRQKIDYDLQRLTDPKVMDSWFRVMAITPQQTEDLIGFSSLKAKSEL